MPSFALPACGGQREGQKPGGTARLRLVSKKGRHACGHSPVPLLKSPWHTPTPPCLQPVTGPENGTSPLVTLFNLLTESKPTPLRQEQFACHFTRQTRLPGIFLLFRLENSQATEASRADTLPKKSLIPVHRDKIMSTFAVFSGQHRRK